MLSIWEKHTLRNSKNSESFMNSIKGRMLVLFIFVFLIGCGLIGRIFYLQIVHGEAALNDFTLKIQKERTIYASRGRIYDRNGKVLAYNELAYNITIEDIYESGRDRNAQMNATLLRVIDIIERNGDSAIGDFNIILNDDNEYEYSC